MSPGPLLLSTTQVSMRLSAEALSAPRYAISKNNLQEKMSRAFPDRGVQQQTDYQRQNRDTIKNIKIAGKMLVNVFDMLGTSSNEVRAVRKWFQQKTNIKYASVTGKLLLLFAQPNITLDHRQSYCDAKQDSYSNRPLKRTIRVERFIPANTQVVGRENS